MNALSLSVTVTRSIPYDQAVHVNEATSISWIIVHQRAS